MFVFFFFFFNSDKSIFAVILSVVTAVYFAGTRKEFILAEKNIVSTFFEKYLMSVPSRKSTSFKLAPPHEVPKLNEHPGHSFDQVRYSY